MNGAADAAIPDVGFQAGRHRLSALAVAVTITSLKMASIAGRSPSDVLKRP